MHLITISISSRKVRKYLRLKLVQDFVSSEFRDFRAFLWTRKWYSMVSRFDWWTNKTNGTVNKILEKHWRQDDTFESSSDVRKLSKALSFKTAYMTPLKRPENGHRLATTTTTKSMNNDGESCSQASMYSATLIRETSKKLRVLPKHLVVTYYFLPITSSDALPLSYRWQLPAVSNSRGSRKGIQRSLKFNIHKLIE